MIQSFPLASSTPSVITIKPVANGWIVEVPKNQSRLLKEQMRDFTDVIKETIQGEGDKNDLDQIMKAAKITMPDEDGIHLLRDQSVHVYKSFVEVLSFLGSICPNEDPKE